MACTDKAMRPLYGSGRGGVTHVLAYFRACCEGRRQGSDSTARLAREMASIRLRGEGYNCVCCRDEKGGQGGGTEEATECEYM